MKGKEKRNVEKKLIREHQEESKRQYNEVYEKNREFIEQFMDKGKVDWSLYSLVLERVNFQDCSNSEEVLKKFYAAIFTYVGKLIRENYNAKALISKVLANVEGEPGLTADDKGILDSLLANQSDPLSMAHTVLDQTKEVARKRAKIKLVMPGQKGYKPPKNVRSR